jgi:uncharacterized protein (DUF1501 family)
MYILNRRQFLQNASLISLSALLPGTSSWAFSNGNINSTNNKLIVILLRGAIDGLSVVPPYGDNRYYDLRPTIAIAKPGQDQGVIDLNGYFGMHPALAPLLPFWQAKTLAFVQAAGSPDPTRSHFDAQDYMETGIPGKKMVTSGWLNRLVCEVPSNKSPLQALSLGAVLPRIFAGTAEVGSAPRTISGNKIVLDRPVIGDLFSELYSDQSSQLGRAYADGMAAHKTIEEAMTEPPKPASSQPIANADTPAQFNPFSRSGVSNASENDGKNSTIDALMAEQKAASRGAPSPKNNGDFGKQLALLMNRDNSIQIAFTDFGGWDTHVNQGNGKGQLANRLSPLAAGLAELVNGLGPLYKQTTIVVMSEFGRTVKENGNRGTDHGHGNAMWLLGGNINGGKVYGRWSDLNESNLYQGRDLPATTDFRDVLCYVLNDHLSVSKKSLANIFPGFTMSGKALA